MSNGRRRMSRRERARIVRRNRIIAAVIGVLVVVAIVASVINVVKKSAGSGFSGELSDTAQNDAETDASGNGNADDSNSQNNSDADLETATDDGDYTSNGFKIEVIDGVTYIDGVLIANKTYSLPEDFVPTDPDQPVTEERSITCLDKTLMSAWNTMLKDATANGLNIYISSGYRSYSYQVKVYNSYVASDGVALADTYSSRPGYSEHQTGLCFDLNTIEDSFQYTDEGKWVNDNCYKYGFCIRFPKGKEAYTGYQYESWHLRYVGIELATKLYNNGDWISLEEYFGITSEYE